MKNYFSGFIDFLIDIETYLRGVKRYFKDRIFKKQKIDQDKIRPRFFFNINHFAVTVKPSSDPAHKKLLESHGYKLMEEFKIEPYEAGLIMNLFFSFNADNKIAGEKIKGEFLFLTKAELEKLKKNYLFSSDEVKSCRKRYASAKLAYEASPA